MFMTLSMSAQMQFNPEEMAKRQADNIKKDCKLDDDQYKQVLDLLTTETKAFMAEMDSIRNAGGGFPGREVMQKRQESQDAALKEILTEEQFAAYQKAQKERMARFQNGAPGQGRRMRH